MKKILSIIVLLLVLSSSSLFAMRKTIKIDEDLQKLIRFEIEMKRPKKIFEMPKECLDRFANIDKNIMEKIK